MLKRFLLAVIICVPLLFSFNWTVFNIINSHHITKGLFEIVKASDLTRGYWRDHKGNDGVSAIEKEEAEEKVKSLEAEIFEFLPLEFEKFQVNGWGLINEEFMDYEDLRNLAQFIWEELGHLEGTIELIETGDARYNIVNGLYIDKEHFMIELILHSVNYGEEFNNKTSTYLVLNIDSIENPKNVINYKEDFAGIIEKMGGKATITTCLTGALNGKLDGGKNQEIINMIFEFLDGKVIEGVYEDTYLSISGYSPKLKENIKIGDKLINFNVAMRFDPYSQKTYLWLGTPILSIEY